MSTIRRISLAATLLAGSALAAAPAFAQEQGFHPVHPAGHAPVHPAGHPPAHPAFHRPVAPGTYRMVRPGVGFHRGPEVIARVHPFHAVIAGHVPFARFSAAQRALWVRGHWYHRWWHGRYGWWWYAGGVWFWYGAPVYPYPTVVSDYYYEEPVNEAGPTWWYCNNPAGYYPYVPNCYVPWTAVPAQNYGPGYGDEENGPDQGPPPAANGGEQGPPPGYDQEDQGYDQGPPPDGEQGPPPGSDQGPPSGDQGPPPGYDQGPPPDDRYPQNSH